MVGQRLSHYHITQQIGAGGMGVVYRARDEQLERDVAIKVLPAGILADDTARKRFRKEALALAKLNHPNIATIYEFGSQDGIDFLVAEYIPGTTLDEKLRGGSPTPKESIALGLQIAQGLAAAHEQGVIHRDLKPGNLRITPDGRLKILDFGLAQLMPQGGNPDVAVTLTQSQQVVGTLPYMAPEQLRGEPCDPRTDIWAVGAVLYEICTGHRPFPERAAPALIDCILNQPPQRPSSLNRKLPAGLEMVILKALDKDPARRYQSTRELGVDLERLAAGNVPVATGRARPSLSVLAPLFLLVIIAGTVGGYWFSHRKKLPSSARVSEVSLASSVKPRRSVAVLGFKNLSGRPEQAWLSTALSEMLTTELAAGDNLLTVPGESVATMKINLSLTEADSYGAETLSKIRANLKADDVVVGSYLPLGKGQIRLDLRVQDAVHGETLASVSEKGAEDQIDLLVTRAGSTLREKLGVRAVSGAEAAQVKATLPAKTEAARLYFEGLAELRSFDEQTGRDLLQKSVNIEPDFALSHGELATAWERLGDIEKARAEARKALDLSGPLSEQERLSTEAHFRRLTGEHDKALQIYQALFKAFPDSLDAGLNLAAALHVAGKDSDATATLEQLRKLPPPVRDDPLIDLAEAEAAESLGDYRQMQAFAGQSAEKARAQGARLLTGRALGSSCWALQNLRRPAEAIKACEESRRLFLDTGSSNNAAYAANTLGAVLDMQGNHAAAKANFEEALSIWRKLGNQHSVAQGMNNLAIFYEGQEDFINAKKMYEQSLAVTRGFHDQLRAAQTVHNIAGLLSKMGDLSGSLSRYEEAGAVGRSLGNKAMILANLLPACRIFYLMGDLVKSRNCLDQAEPLLRETTNKNAVAFGLTIWGDVLTEENDLPAARKKLEELQKVRVALGDKDMIASSNVSLAALAIEEARPEEAVGPLRKIVEDSGSADDADAEIEARMVLARALLAMGNATEAEKMLDGGRTKPSKEEQFHLGLLRPIENGRIRAALGHAAEAEKILKATLTQAKTSGYVTYEYHARLALAEIVLGSGKLAEGRGQLRALEKEARAGNFLLAAAKAQRALENPPNKKQ
jgi:serine/threonine protein kinase/tetratricopeptide (TPR) repeat protein